MRSVDAELDGAEYEVVQQCCYVGEMLAVVRSGLKKFRELLTVA